MAPGHIHLTCLGSWLRLSGGRDLFKRNGSKHNARDLRITSTKRKEGNNEFGKIVEHCIGTNVAGSSLCHFKAADRKLNTVIFVS